MSDVKFELDYIPKAKERPRIGRNNRTYTPNKTVKAETEIQKSFLGQVGLLEPIPDGAVELRIYFYYAVPKSWTKAAKGSAIAGGFYKTSTPDIDNLIKTVKDALNGHAYQDDSQIASLVTSKRYADRERTVIHITWL